MVGYTVNGRKPVGHYWDATQQRLLREEVQFHTLYYWAPGGCGKQPPSVPEVTKRNKTYLLRLAAVHAEPREALKEAELPLPYEA